MAERIEVPVPEGFPPMTEPVLPGNRAEHVEVVLARDEHLPAMAKTFEQSYPAAVLDSVNDPSSERDIAHTIKRLSATLNAPDITMLVATMGHNGPFAGCAAILNAARPPSNEHHMHIFHPLAFKKGHNFMKLMGWTDAEVDEMHSGLRVDVLEAIMDEQQRKREKLMGDHNYMMAGPIWVPAEYRSRGISSKLMRAAFEMSRKANVPLLLSGVFPNAAPAYLHLGFERVDGSDSEMLWWPEGLVKGRVEGGRLVY